MAVDLKDIKSIIDLMRKNAVTEFELEKQDFKIRLKRGANGGGAAAAGLHRGALSRKWARQTKGIGFKPAGEEFRIASAAGGTERP